MGRVDVNIGTNHIHEGEGAGAIHFHRVELATHDDFTPGEAAGVKSAAMIEDVPTSIAAIGAWYAALPPSPLNDKRRAWWASKLLPVERERFRIGLRALHPEDP
jgi:hypothetical protein